MMQSLICLLVLLTVQAWVPPVPSCALKNSRHRVLWSSPDEESSFEDAGRRIVDEDNEEMAANIERDEEDDEFEERSKEYEAIRAAIRERNSEIGIERAVETIQLIEEANARAAAGEKVTGLDLSKLTGTLPQSMDDDDEDEDSMNLPTMPEDLEEKFKELTPEQRKAIDPTDGEGLIAQFKEELQYIEWPTPFAILKEVGLVMLCVAFMAFVVINWDNFLRETLYQYDIIPKPDEVTQQFEGLKLPDGWTDGLTDRDIVSVPETE